MGVLDYPRSSTGFVNPDLHYSGDITSYLFFYDNMDEGMVEIILLVEACLLFGILDMVALYYLLSWWADLEEKNL